MEWMQYQFHMESIWGGLNYEDDLQDILEGVSNLECACLLCGGENIFIKPNMMGSVDKKIWSGFQYRINPLVAAYPMK